VLYAGEDLECALGETVFGVRTVKSLALEPQRKALWDEKIAEAGKWRMAYGRLANWPQTLITPVERFMWMGAILLGVYWALSDSSGTGAGALFAFMMLSQRSLIRWCSSPS
jgi:ATP-binding cassette subfamily B protein